MVPERFEFLEKRKSDLDSSLSAGTLASGSARAVLKEDQRAVHTYVCGISGSGKTRFLQSLMFQDISKGHPVCVLDPMGDLYERCLEYVASCVERAGDRGFRRQDLLDSFLFLDATDPENPIRFNPLEPQAGESSEEQVDDLMRALERLLGGTLEEQRKLRNILRGAFLMIAELNRLPPFRRPKLPAGRQSEFPLNIGFAVDLLTMNDPTRLGLMNALPDNTRLHFRRRYWEFYAFNSESQKNLIVQSSWNAFQYLLDDSLVLRVFDTRHSTVSLAEVLRSGKSLFCHLPTSENLAGARFLGKYITTKLQHAARRRPEAEWSRSYYLYLDEFQHWADAAFADAMTHLRKYGLRVTNAHQSQSQPPFDTAEGLAILRTVQANSRIKVLFRLARPDAELLARELFPLSQRKENFQAADSTTGRTETQTTGWSETSGQSASHGQNSATSFHHSFESSGDSHQTRSGSSLQSGSSSSSSRSDSTARGTSESVTTRTVYYTLEGERELLINSLQALGSRQCYLFTEALDGRLVDTTFVPDGLYCFQAQNSPRALIESQRQRLSPPVEKSQVVPDEPGGVVVPWTPNRREPAAVSVAGGEREAESAGGPWAF